MEHKYNLTLNCCPHGIKMISIDDQRGGTNLTGQKCCGRWNVIKEWPMSIKQLKLVAYEITQAIQNLEDV